MLSLMAPTRVSYTETVDVSAEAADVFDDIRLQARLARWSAWPKETGSMCALDSSPKRADGTVGARMVFVSKGRPIGHQEIVELIDQRLIALELDGPGPPHRAFVRFEVEELDAKLTRVHLHFVNELPRPFNAIWRFAGLSQWTRSMHKKDLAGLKAFSEPPHRDIDGRIVGRTPSLPNPYETALPVPDKHK